MLIHVIRIEVLSRRLLEEVKGMKSIKWMDVIIGLAMASAAMLEFLFKKIRKAASHV